MTIESLLDESMIDYGFEKIFPITLDLLRHSLEIEPQDKVNITRFQQVSQRIQKEHALNDIDLFELTTTFEIDYAGDESKSKKLIENLDMESDAIDNKPDDLGPK